MQASTQGMMEGVDQQGQAQPNAVSMPGGVQAAPRPQTPAAPQAQQPPVRTGIFDRILETLGGGPKKSYTVDPDTGKLEEHDSQDTRGNLFKHVLAGMLTGLAAGSQQHGPGAGIRGLGAGISASANLAEAQDEQKKIQAQKDAENQNAATLRRAQIQRYNFEELMQLRNEKRLDQESFDRHMQGQQQLIGGIRSAGGTLVPVVVNGKDINAGDTPGNDADLMKAYAGGQIKAGQGSHLVLTTDRQQDGTMIHHVWNVPDDALNTQMAVPDDIKKFFNIPDTASTMPLRQILNLTGNMNDRRNNDVERQLKEEQIKTQQSEQKKNAADTGKTQEETDQLKNSVVGGADPFGVPVGRTPQGGVMNRKELDAAQKTFNKDYVEPLHVLQKTSLEFQRINSNPKQTGAEKVTALLNAVGISGDPLKGKGFRVNNDIIAEHAQARNIWESAVQKLNTIAGTGGPITSKQISDYTAVAQGVIHDAFVTAAQEARRQGLPVDFLPRAITKNQVPDAMTAKIYLDSAGGDLDAAHNAMVAAGYAQ